MENVSLRKKQHLERTKYFWVEDSFVHNVYIYTLGWAQRLIN